MAKKMNGDNLRLTDSENNGPEEPTTSRVPRQKLRIFVALVLREMASRFGQSWGGYLWAIAEPAGGVLLLALVFSLALFKPPVGNSFMFFYATGIIPFFMYNAVANAAANSIRMNKGLLTYPVVSAFDTLLARTFLEVLTYIVTGAVLMGAIIILDDVPLELDPAALTMTLLLTTALGLGVGAFNAVLFGFLPTWRNIWSVLNRPLFIISGVMFTYDMVPPSLQKVLWYNPIVHIIGQMRSAFFASYDASYTSPSYVLGVSLSLFVVGAYLIRRHESYLIQN